MKHLIDTVLFLSTQELSFRDHDESVSSINGGNFKELWSLTLKHNSSLAEHAKFLSNVFLGTSKEIQNELISIISTFLKDRINFEIKNASFFAILADDTTDISAKCQCAISVRYMYNTTLQERFLGFFDVSIDRTAGAMFELISSIIKDFDYKNKMVGQCYDGASVMAEELSGLQARVKSIAPIAHFVHCSAHRLNLTLQQSAYLIRECRIFFSTINSIPQFFHHSAKRTTVLDRLVGARLPTACQTRWYSQSNIISNISSHWSDFKAVFDNIMNDRESNSESICKAKGFFDLFENFEFAYLTIIYSYIFNYTDILFKVLQSKQLDAAYCSTKISDTIEFLNSIRTEQMADKFFENALNKTSFPTGRKLHNMSQQDIRVKYRILYFNIVDNIVVQLRSRFQDFREHFEYLALIDSNKFNMYKTDFPTEPFNSLKKAYAIFDFIKLKSELFVIYRDQSFYQLDSPKKMFDLLVNENLQDVFPQFYSLMCLILTLPVTSVTVERHFSCLKRIKNYLRNSKTQDNDLARLSIEKHMIRNIFSNSPEVYDEIIDTFDAQKKRAIHLKYK